MDDPVPIVKLITLDNWRTYAAGKTCPDCGAGPASWQVRHNPNNNSQFLVCACGTDHPMRADRVVFLRHSQTSRREKAPETLRETWARSGDYCYGCGRTRAALIAANVGLQQHHTRPYADAGHAGRLIPLCSWCHDSISTIQRIVRQVGKHGGAA